MPSFRRPRPISPFKTLEEEAEFRDTRDLADVFEGRVTIEELLDKESTRRQNKGQRRRAPKDES